MFFRYVYIFISKKRIYIFDDYKNWNVRIRRKESLFDLLKARYFLRFSKIRIFRRSWKNRGIFLKVRAIEFRRTITSIKIEQISTREFSFERKSYSPIITNSTRFIHASLIGSLWTFDISNFLECNGWKWWLRKASKANIFFVGFSYDERATGFEKIFSEMEWLFYRTFSNVTADFSISRRQFRWHYWQSYGICFIASADTKRNIFKYSSRLYYYFSLYSLFFLLKS